MDFTTKRNKGYAFLNLYVLVMRCESVTLRTLVRAGHRGSREMETGGGITRARQRGVKNIITLNRLVTHARRVNTYALVREGT